MNAVNNTTDIDGNVPQFASDSDQAQDALSQLEGEIAQLEASGADDAEDSDESALDAEIGGPDAGADEDADDDIV